MWLIKILLDWYLDSTRVKVLNKQIRTSTNQQLSNKQSSTEMNSSILLVFLCFIGVHTGGVWMGSSWKYYHTKINIFKLLETLLMIWDVNGWLNNNHVKHYYLGSNNVTNNNCIIFIKCGMAALFKKRSSTLFKCAAISKVKVTFWKFWRQFILTNFLI